MQQVVLGVDGDVMGCDRARPRVDDDFAFGAELVADPPQPNVPDVEHANRAAKGGLGPVDQAGINGIHEPPVNLARRLVQHTQDRHRDDQPDDRVA